MTIIENDCFSIRYAFTINGRVKHLITCRNLFSLFSHFAHMDGMEFVICRRSFHSNV